MDYKTTDIDLLFKDFYYYVNNIILDIHNDNYISHHLFYCEYYNLNNNNYENIPLTICLGGAGYLQYKDIFDNNNIIINKTLNSYDYDITMSLYDNIPLEKYKTIKKQIYKIINNNLSSYQFKNLTRNIFKIDEIKHNDRLHIRILCDTKLNKKFHILELSFWFNGKISDNFTINNFYSSNLLLYKTINNIYYYLLPIELLVKTTLYAIVDFFERRNFQKCVKYIERAMFIKEVYDDYTNKKVPTKKILMIDILLRQYKNKIKRKIKMINDYPYITSYLLQHINNNGIIKCIYRNFRVNNRKTFKNQYLKYKDDCKNEKVYIDSENTLQNTEE